MSLKKVQIVGAYNEGEAPSPIDVDTVRQALRDWSSLKDLGQSPLVSLQIVRERSQQTDGKDTPAKKGMALRAVLGEALEALQPEAGPPQTDDKRWQAFLILNEQYLHGPSPEWVQNQLFVSKGTYFHEQKRALETLTEILTQWEDDVQSCSSPASISGRKQIPFMAPALPDHIRIGAQAALDELRRALLHTSGSSLLGLYGLPGVGKTTLATILAHDAQIRARYPDGILWAGAGRQADLHACLETWAEALGIPSAAFAAETDSRARAALLQRAVGQQRMLLIIDDVWKAETGMALKIGGSGCTHLFITRRPETAMELAGQRVLHLAELDALEGARLLAQFAPAVAEEYPARIATLVEAVGGLPLALVLMGRYIQKQSHAAQSRRVEQALMQLEDAGERFRLTLPVSPLEIRTDFTPGTPFSLQTVIGLSAEDLSPEEMRTLACLALFPPKPNTFSEDAALFVSGAAEEVLDRLVDSGLLEGAAPDRYTLHSTIADYARLTVQPQGAAARLAAWGRRTQAALQDEPALLEAERENLCAAIDLEAARSESPTANR